MLDAHLIFDKTPKNLNAGNADQNGTDVYDAGAALRLFQGNSKRAPVFAGNYKITAGTGALSFRARLVGSSAAALNADVEILADTGVLLTDTDGTALAIGDEIHFEIPVTNQRVASRYYGVIYTQGTADQDGEPTAYITETPQSHMVRRKAAVP